ncbi:MAG TPA: glucose-6-phosphate isomerase, partial [Planctomycetaceae bacterium]|nr:glucose-6-phosphate isomerase [Planctomycetaceae bacterium]
MKMLRFDPSGSINAEFGVTNDQLKALYPRLMELRQEMVEVDAAQYASGEVPADKQPLDARFYWLPQEMLDDYTKQREASELGRIFKVANSLVKDIDAVVVLGIGGSYMGARAMMDACCNPYHNELRRAGRGSKPRM